MTSSRPFSILVFVVACFLTFTAFVLVDQFLVRQAGTASVQFSRIDLVVIAMWTGLAGFAYALGVWLAGLAPAPWAPLVIALVAVATVVAMRLLGAPLRSMTLALMLVTLVLAWGTGRAASRRREAK